MEYLALLNIVAMLMSTPDALDQSGGRFFVTPPHWLTVTGYLMWSIKRYNARIKGCIGGRLRPIVFGDEKTQ